jgi:hypothetical protein
MTDVPAVLVEATELVIGDLLDATGPDVRLHLEPAPDVGSWQVYAVFDDMTAGFAVVVRRERRSAVIVAVADGLQHAFIEHL